MSIGLLRIAFWGALAFALTMAFLPHPPDLHGIGDKWQHMAAFGTLTTLACAGYPTFSLTHLGERLSFVGAMIEVVQSIPALHRDCDIRDWIADTGIIAAVLIVVALHRKRSSLRNSSTVSDV